jgi:protocatechuate 3,4-dioxygenase beta subunit
MQDLDHANITAAVNATWGDGTDPRLREILEALVRHLHELAREVNLTHAEWQQAIEFLYQVGRKTTRRRNEFILLSDILGVSSLVDMLASRGPDGATERSVLGPFYLPNAPMLPVGGGDMRRDNPGEPVLVRGRVYDASGRGIGGALMEVWQNAANGLYSNQDPDQADDNLRCRLNTATDGAYAFTTIRPVPYSVPTDGPVGGVLRATGRHPWRTAHIHFRVTAPGYDELVTELFPADDPYIDGDAVFGVRASLAVPFRRSDSAELAAAHGLPTPFGVVDYDFGLCPAG